MTSPQAPGRPRSFDADEALDRAVDVFWERGFQATTTRDLANELGIKQSSMYNAFGSKRDLLLRAVDRYEARIEAELFALLRTGDGYAALQGFFGALVDWIRRNSYRGCLVVNLMASESTDPVILERVVAYRRKIRSGMRLALDRIDGIGQEERTARAELLVAAVLGLHLTARSAADTDEVAAMVAGVEHQIEEWARA